MNDAASESGSMTDDDVLWLHRKSGGLYRRAIARALMEADKNPVVVYQSLETGIYWVRPSAEFYARFEPLVPEAQDEPRG